MSFKNSDLDSLANSIFQAASQSPQHLKYTEEILEKLLIYIKSEESNNFPYDQIEHNHQQNWEGI